MACHTCYKIPTFRAYSPIVVNLILISIVSAMSQSHPLFDANVAYDPAPDSSSCCDLEINGPSKVPGVDSLTYRVIDCNDTRGHSGSSYSMSSLPSLSKVEMCTNLDGDFNLNFVLSLPLEEIIKGRLTDVQVTFGAPPGGGSNPRYFRPVCRQFAFTVDRSLLPVNTAAVDKVEISYSCLARNLDEGTFTFQIKPLPWLQQLDYQLVWAYYYDYSGDGLWSELLVGVAPVSSANQIAVVFQPPKAASLVDGLLVELLSFPERLVNSSTIRPSQTSFVFHNVTEGRYWVRVTPLSALCRMDNDICTVVSSAEVLVFGLPQAQPVGRQRALNVQVKENPASHKDGYSGLGSKLDIGMVAVAVVVILGLSAVLFAVVLWLVKQRSHWHGRRSTPPTLRMISPALSPLEIKAVQHLAMALSNVLGIPVTLTWRDQAVHDGQSDNDQLVLMVYPDSDSIACQEREERWSPCAQTGSNKDILALVAFSRSQDYRSHYYDDFIQNPTLLNIVANISYKSYQKVIVILFTEQIQIVPNPKLYFSVSEESGRSNWEEIENDSDYQLTVPLRPPKSQKESDNLSVCHPQEFCFQKLLSSCNTFNVPQGTQQLYHHLKSRVFKVNPRHKFPSAEDIESNEKWLAAHEVANRVLKGQCISLKDVDSEFPGTCLTIDAVSLCGLTNTEIKSQKQLPSEEDLRICPPRDIVADNICFNFNSDCDSFSNFSEMRRDLFS